VQSSGAAEGTAIHNPNKSESKRSAALASPASYVDATFYAAAGVPYRLWFRMRAESDNYANDSMFVQFDRSVNAQGQAVNRIGSSSAAVAFLEEGNGAGVAGWGWNDTAYGGTAMGDVVYFSTSGLQKIRLQQREDGIMWDQIVLSAATYQGRRPGDTKSDDFIVPDTFGSSAGIVASHAYPKAGAYPLVLTVADAQGKIGWAATTVTVGSPGQSTSLDADAGGPYTGGVNQQVTFDASGSEVPSGVTAAYRWTFGDEIVLDSRTLRAVGTRWRTVSDASAANRVAFENPNAGAAKIATPLASPSSYIEGSFQAAEGVPYRVWVRMRADGDSFSNDSVYMQFSGAVTSGGSATARIGTTSAHGIVLEEGNGAGMQGWGWADHSYGGLGAPVYFNDDAVQTIRVQQREDGLRIDQIVISAEAHFDAAPGSRKADGTIVPVFGPGSTGERVSHDYGRAGTYPVTLTLDGGTAGSGTDTTSVVIK
jgi:hypothetical protein